MSLRIDAEERRARLAERHLLLSRTRTDELPQIADDLVALHSSDPVTVFLSAMARMAHPSIEAVEQALYADRSLIRHHGMRRTLWVATPQVARLIHAAATRDLVANERRRTSQLLAAADVEDPEKWLAEAELQVLADIRGRGPSTAREIGQRVGALRHRLQLAPGKSSGRSVGPHPGALHSRLRRPDVRGRPSSWINGAYRYAEAESWLPGGLGELDPRQAAGELAGRWLQRFGPGTTVDLQWWMGWTVPVRSRRSPTVEPWRQNWKAWLVGCRPTIQPRRRSRVVGGRVSWA